MKDKKKGEESNIEEDNKLLNEMLYVFEHPREEIDKMKYYNQRETNKVLGYLKYCKNKRFNIPTKEETYELNKHLEIWKDVNKKAKKTMLIRKTLGCYKCKNYVTTGFWGSSKSCKIIVNESMYRIYNLKLKCRYFEKV